MRQDEQAERNHPEAEDRQKTEQATNDEQGADQDAQQRRIGQRDTPRAEHDLTGLWIDAEIPLLAVVRHYASFNQHPNSWCFLHRPATGSRDFF